MSCRAAGASTVGRRVRSGAVRQPLGRAGSHSRPVGSLLCHFVGAFVVLRLGMSIGVLVVT
eukprot:15193839-Alexandrium_andersonii.AAC.1